MGIKEYVESLSIKELEQALAGLADKSIPLGKTWGATLSCAIFIQLALMRLLDPSERLSG